jgi:hypothetical protein
MKNPVSALRTSQSRRRLFAERSRRDSITDSIRQFTQRSSCLLRETAEEVQRLTLSKSVSVSVLVTEEVTRLRAERHLVFPETPEKWDMFWIGLLVIFVFSTIPGLFYFASRHFPYHWTPLNQTLTHERSGVNMQLYETAGYGVVTPLQRPVHSFFFLHVCSAFLSSALLVILFTTGRVMRWRLADGTIHYDSADDLHRLAAFWSFLLWTVIIITGALTIPLLHPTLQVANYAELVGVLTMFLGVLGSAYTRQWVFHRLCAWGLIYSATASVFVGLSGRSLQALTGYSAYQVKAVGYTVAFCVPILGLIRDIYQEVKKLNRDNNEFIQSLSRERYQRNVNEQKLNFVKQIKPFKGARSDKMRRLSLLQHIAAREPEEDFCRRRSSVIGLQPHGQLSQSTLVQLNLLYDSASPTNSSDRKQIGRIGSSRITE